MMAITLLISHKNRNCRSVVLDINIASVSYNLQNIELYLYFLCEIQKLNDLKSLVNNYKLNWFLTLDFFDGVNILVAFM